MLAAGLGAAGACAVRAGHALVHAGRFGIEHLLVHPLRDAREVFERDYITTQLGRFGGNISRTAQFIGMERSALHRKIKLLGLTGRSEEDTEL